LSSVFSRPDSSRAAWSADESVRTRSARFSLGCAADAVGGIGDRGWAM
jgi:hypothetical protein